MTLRVKPATIIRIALRVMGSFEKSLLTVFAVLNGSVVVRELKVSDSRFR